MASIKNRYLYISIITLFLASTSFAMENQQCQPVLWPVNSLIFEKQALLEQEPLKQLKKSADKFVTSPTHAVTTLASAGVYKANDSGLIQTRLAFQDADHAAVLALAYALNHDEKYFQKARDILLTWAKTNEPTGNPIDESRLSGMIWAYDLIACDLSNQDRLAIINWFTLLKIKKQQKHWGYLTINNNHHIHQLKMLLLLDKVLHDDVDWQKNLSEAKKYSLINIDSDSGATVDYKERDALYYHNFVLQAWIEINLITQCCQYPVSQAFQFLAQKINNNDINNEFMHSIAKIDEERDKGGFDYAKKGRKYDVRKSAATIIGYYTPLPENIPQNLAVISQTAKPSPWLTFIKSRQLLWTRHYQQ